ncbi:MAG: hypothetical protein NZ739_00345 [Verrucomicrobiae bacterium]|nr:hypothetical protein [Verrucomicrobiae bacterium]MDW7979347.1 hypothetical protein [Verrucomicrobiales bacterium]
MRGAELFTVSEFVERSFPTAGGDDCRTSIAEIVRRVDARYRPVWEKCTVEQQIALARYFLPHNSERPVLAPTRPRLIKWYCPFASQREFPSGHRYCINVYTGCAHGCVYCYARSYEPQQASPKRDFARMLARDLADLDRFNVPPAPVHLSNSTDPFQPLELRMRHNHACFGGHPCVPTQIWHSDDHHQKSCAGCKA